MSERANWAEVQLAVVQSETGRGRGKGNKNYRQSTKELNTVAEANYSDHGTTPKLDLTVEARLGMI